MRQSTIKTILRWIHIIVAIPIVIYAFVHALLVNPS